MRLKTQWIAGMNTDAKENFYREVISAKNVLDKLREIVYNKSIEKQTVSFSDYDSPAWLAKQAHTNGYAEALRDVLSLLEFKEARTNG